MSIATAVALVGCSGGGPEGGGNGKKCLHTTPSGSGKDPFLFNVGGEPETLDPAGVRLPKDLFLVKVFYEGLMRSDGEGKRFYALAKEVDVSEEGTLYRFTLRESEWSDGSPVTSYDFAYAFKRALSPSFEAPNVSLLYVIKNAKAIKEGRLPSGFLGVETPDAHTLVVRLTRKVPHFLSLVEHPLFFPVKAGSDGANLGVSNGPFRILKRVPHRCIEAVIRSRHGGEETSARTVTIGTEGRTPAIGTPVLRALGCESSPVLATEWIKVNGGDPLLRSKKIRRAFARALNTREMISGPLRGGRIPATGILPDFFGKKEPDDLTGKGEARPLFEEGLRERGANEKIVVPLVFIYPEGEENRLLAETVRNQWRVFPEVEVRLESLDREEYRRRVDSQEYTFALKERPVDFNDPVGFLGLFTEEFVGGEEMRAEALRYAKLLEESSGLTDESERLFRLRRCEKLLMEETPVIPLCHRVFPLVEEGESVFLGK